MPISNDPEEEPESKPWEWPGMAQKEEKIMRKLKVLIFYQYIWLHLLCLLQGNPHKILVALCGVVQSQLQLTVVVSEIIVYIFIDTEFYCLFSGFFTWMSLIKILNTYVIVTEFVILG